jgi:ribosomal protein L5
MSQTFKLNYQQVIVPKLQEQFGFTNVMEVPKVIKITVNRGLGEAATNAKALESSVAEIAKITGQKPVITRAKKAIAGFKIRQGMPVGVMVTLRGDRMYAFLDRFINLSLPRIRDFAASARIASMDAATTASVFGSSSFFLKLSTTKSIKFAGWIFLLSPPQTTTRKAVRC